MSPLRQHTSAMRRTQAQRMGGIHSTFQSVRKRAATVGNRSQRAWDLFLIKGSQVRVLPGAPASSPCRAAPWRVRTPTAGWQINGRSGRIRTADPLTPSQVRYQAAPRSDRPARGGTPPPGRAHYSARLQARPTFRVEGRARRGLQRMKGPHSGSADPLTDAEKRFFVQQGFLHVASAVPTSFVRRARRAINHSLGAGIDKRGVARMNARVLLRRARGGPAAASPCDEPEGLVVCALAGRGSPRGEAQGVPDRLALSTARRNAPHARCSTPGRLPHAVQRHSGRRCLVWVHASAHLDGYHTPYNGIPDDGVVYGFTLLLGVMLSDADEPLSGNFTVWPGTHLKLELHFRVHGVHSLERGDVTASGIRLPRPIPITGKSGDIVLAHYQLAHAASPNLSGDIRYMCFSGSRCADWPITASIRC